MYTSLFRREEYVTQLPSGKFQVYLTDRFVNLTRYLFQTTLKLQVNLLKNFLQKQSFISQFWRRIKKN